MRDLVVRIGLCTAVVVGGGCRNDKATRQDDARAKVTVTSGGAPAASASQASRLRTRMRDHEVHGLAMRDAIARADLGTARREAQILAELRVDGAEIPAGFRQNVAAMHAAVTRVVDSRNLEEASSVIGLVAVSCGECHATLGGPRTTLGGEPPSSAELLPRMQRHRWAADRLWDGLVVPSDDAWRAGARVLADAPLEPERVTPGKTPVLAVTGLAHSVHTLAERAKLAETPVDRGALYSELIATCSACHERTGGGPSPTR